MIKKVTIKRGESICYTIRAYYIDKKNDSPTLSKNA